MSENNQNVVFTRQMDQSLEEVIRMLERSCVKEVVYYLQFVSEPDFDEMNSIIEHCHQQVDKVREVKSIVSELLTTVLKSDDIGG